MLNVEKKVFCFGINYLMKKAGIHNRFVHLSSSS